MLSSTRSKALLLVGLAVLLLLALILFISYGNKTSQSPLQNSTLLSNLTKNGSPAAGDFAVEGSGDVSTESPNFGTQITLLNDEESLSSSATTPATTSTTSTAFTPVDDTAKEALPGCAIAKTTERPRCEVENQPPRSAYEKWIQWDTRNGSVNLVGDVQPVHYDVNVSIANADSRLLKASAEIFVRVPTEALSIPLHVDRTIINFNVSRIFVRNCRTGEFVCVKSFAQLIEKQLIVLLLASPISESTLISVYFEQFDVQIYSNPGLVLQSPSKWEKQRAWILGSLFDEIGARTVFPCIDQSNVKASWRFCCQHPSNMTSRSNMPSEVVLEQEANTIQNCFEKSPPLRPDHFSFVIFDNLLGIHSDSNSPLIEVFVSKHLESVETKWIVLEIQTALKKMAELAGLDYPLTKLSVISMPLPVDATHGYGLINIKESWVEYPKYLLTHTILNRQIVQQWVSNLFTICDQCIQEGLANYLEWVVSADFETVNIEPKKRALDARQKLLQHGNDRSPLRALLIEPSKSENECVQRSALVFAMLDEAFGIEAIKRFVQALSQSKSWSTCASNAEISNMLFDATLSPVSQQIFNSFSSSKNYPVLRLKLRDNHLTVSSESSNKNEPHEFMVAYSILNEQGTPTSLINNGSESAHDVPGQTVIVSPTSSGLFRTVYDIDNYRRLTECFIKNQCNKLAKSGLENVYEDLCWALLFNRLDPSNSQAAQWHELFGLIDKHELVKGDCHCCMQSRSKSNAQCKWVWKDKCSRLALKIDQ